MTAVTVTVPGKVIGQGNIRHLGKGRPAVHQNAKVLKPWRESIAWHTRQEMACDGVEMFGKGEPVALTVDFILARPKTAPGARWAPVVRPDLDHYLRALCDALSGVLVEDDAQIVTVTASKVYGTTPGVTFTVAPAVRGQAVAA